MQTQPPAPDELLVRRARALDQSAFDELVGRHTPKLRRLVARIVDTHSDQEEAMQNALVSAWANLPRFEGRACFGSWMFRVAANAALMVRRANKRHPEPVGDVAELERLRPPDGARPMCPTGTCWIDRPDEAMQRMELRALLERNVVELPALLREAFLLRYVDELSIKVCAERLRISEAAVKTRCHRACLALRAAIHRDQAGPQACRSKSARPTDTPQ
jgi:RNA polymerase sigma-70 factor, ECF subfamily